MYNNVELAKFINNVMTRGKKSTAQRICYSAFDIIKEESNREPLEVFQMALRNATPMVEVKPKRVGGATYQVPTELRPSRSEALAIRWLIRGARGRKGIPMRRGLANELMEASRGEGTAVRRKEELHRMAEANRAFVHYRR
jgi:small subunit ribosomal protein S7